jgi:hypothetical protein
VQGNWSGTGNIDADPRFVNAEGQNLRLSAESPCIDAGSNAAVPEDTLDLDGDGNKTEPLPFDLDGHLRFVDDPVTPDCQWCAPPETCGTAPIVDMGAYEFIPAIPCDFGHNGDVDGDDLAQFDACWSGPNVPRAEECGDKDFDADNDVDQSDFGICQRCYSGKGNPANPNCGQ